MKFPFVSRKYHDSQVLNLLAIQQQQLEQIKLLRELNRSRDVQIIEQATQIDALMAQLTTKSVIITPEPKPNCGKSGEPSVYGRAGWRGIAQQLSESTIPVEADSIKRLESKVAKEGGKVDVSV